MEKATLGFRIYKIWQILKRFTENFRPAQTLKKEEVPKYVCNLNDILANNLHFMYNI